MNTFMTIQAKQQQPAMKSSGLPVALWSAHTIFGYDNSERSLGSCRGFSLHI
jgi:hypothetical protein